MFLKPCIVHVNDLDSRKLLNTGAVKTRKTARVLNNLVIPL